MTAHAAAATTADVEATVRWTHPPGPACPLPLRAVNVLRWDERRIELEGEIHAHGGVPGFERPASPVLAPLRIVIDAAGRTVTATSDACALSGTLEITKAPRADIAARLDALQGANCEARGARLGSEHPWTLLCASGEVRAAIDAGRYREARDLAARTSTALAMLAGAGQRDALMARALHAEALLRGGERREAQALVERVEAERRALLGDAHPETLRASSLLATALAEQGRRAEAATIFATVLEREQSRGGDPARPDVVRARNNLANAWVDDGQPSRAVPLFRENLAIRSRTLGGDDRATWVAAYNLARALWLSGAEEEAVPLLESAASGLARTLGPDHPNTLLAKNQLAGHYFVLRQDEEAVELQQAIHESARTRLGAAHPETLLYQSNLGTYYSRLGLHDEAIRAFEEVIAHAPAASLQTDLRLLGWAQLAAGRPALARDAFARSLPEGGEGRIDALTLAQLGSVAGIAQARFALGERDEALAQMAAVHARKIALVGADHPESLSTLATLGDYQDRRGRHAQATATLLDLRAITGTREESLDALDARRAVANRWVVGGTERASYRTLARLLATGTKPDAARALDVIEDGKGRALGDVLASRAQQDPATRDRQREAQRKLGAIEERLARAEPGGAAFLAALGEHREQLEALASLRGATTGPPRAAALSVPPGLAFVHYVLDRDRAVAIVLRAGRPLAAIDLGVVPSLRDTVETWRRMLADAGGESRHAWRLPQGGYRWSLARPEGGVRAGGESEVGRFLARRLLEPLRPALGTETRLVISPDGALAFVPFEALPLATGRALERYEITYALSLSVWQQQRALPARSGRDLLAIALPDPAVLAPADRSLGALPLAEGEVRNIASRFPENTARVLAGAEATPAAFEAMDREGRLVGYRYLHIAAHGEFDARRPSLSAIVLATGRVSAARWARMQLGADVAVLSACDTARGRVATAEGVMGLPYAFALAGARATVLSLWSVADASTADLMPRFYGHLLGGRDPAAALRQAKLDLLRSRGPWAAPRHWAAFVLHGASDGAR